ncbi:TetR family transcriptional regulator [Mycolicibacter sp. MYC017]|uniref:TetR family transcriptional regulator n=2 Tax=[Mycobacterium] vasticus TaxID=2875777 RepID=A0ABU5Z2T3_9MYCO|nr:TetR family transcriptional regulator [Mycolicibacter sp. MYC017]
MTPIGSEPIPGFDALNVQATPGMSGDIGPTGPADVSCDDGKGDADHKAEDERSRLLSAAMQVLQRSGWWGFKVESVLRQAGLSTRSFYRHFEKKTDLLLALLEHELGGAAISLQRVIAAADTPSEKVRAYVRATIDMAYREDLAKPSSLFASHWRDLLPEYPEAIDRCIERMMSPLVAAITEGQARGEFHSDDPVADAKAIFFLVSGMTADQAVSRVSTPREEFEHIVMPFITRAIGLR